MGSGPHCVRRASALCCALALLAARADASSVLFDFDLLPDAVFADEDELLAGVPTPLGCSEPVLVSNFAHAYEVCAAGDALQNMEFGIAKGYRQAVDGLTLTLSSQTTSQSPPRIESVDWLGGDINCGNTSDCYPYLADFSEPLLSAQVEVLGVAENGGGAQFPFEILQIYLEAWSEPGATGSLLGRIELPGALAPVVIAFTAPDGTTIGSLLFGATTTDHGACHGATCDNLAVIDNLLVTPVPEPSTSALLALGLVALAWRRRSR